MNLVLDRCAVVVLGSWNQAIFTPEWVGKKLFPSAMQVSFEVGLGPLVAFKFVVGNVTLVVAPSHVEFKPVIPADTAFAEVETTVLKLMDALPETPVRAFGINIGYVVDRASAALAELLALPDVDRLREFGATADTTTITRKLKLAQEVVNLAITHTPGQEVGIDINFHHDVPNCTYVKTKLQGTLLKRKATAAALLERTYGITES